MIFEHRVGGAGASGSLTVGWLGMEGGGCRGRCTGVPSCPFSNLLIHPVLCACGWWDK